MQTSVTPFLMFQGKAEEAMNLYVSLIPNSKVLDIKRYEPGGPAVMTGKFLLGGMPVMCLESAVKHAFTFTPSMSLFVTCASEAELERIAGVLAEGGEYLMPIGNYGFSRKYAWLNDRYGVSWQLNVE